MLFIGITGGVGAGKSAVLDYLRSKPRVRVMLADEIAHDLMEPGTECYKRILHEFTGTGIDAELLFTTVNSNRPKAMKVCLRQRLSGAPTSFSHGLRSKCADLLNSNDADYYDISEVANGSGKSGDLSKPGDSGQADGSAENVLAGSNGLCLPDGHFDRAVLARVIFSNEGRRRRMNAIVHPAVKEFVREECEKERRNDELDFLFLEAALLIEEGYGEICDELWYIYADESVRRERLKSSRGYTDERINGILKSQLSEKEYRKSCRVTIDNGGDLLDTYTQIDCQLDRCRLIG